ncbi:TetR/AcrR family transcriptional regulator [Rhodococcus sp. NPDC057529]|uniref:TetR/AcrR family transcriptional regulator n=1 Tax=Rhodococcus sp. NPDC057529 TaxID=3346158 RepID=UPI0036703398
MTAKTKSEKARPLRSDTRRNHRRLMAAVGEIARESPEDLTMQAVAARAEIGPATAYRYYSTMDDVLAAYVLGVIEQLRSFSAESTLGGREHFDAVVACWLELLDEHGAAMVQLRSRRGFLERLHAENDIIVTVERAWRPPLVALLDELGLSTDLIEYALFLCNMIFDPREVHDLRTAANLSHAEVSERLTAAFLGALHGWAGAGK